MKHEKHKGTVVLYAWSLMGVPWLSRGLVALVSGVCGRGKVGLGVGDALEGRSATRAYLGLTGEMARASVRASLLALTRPPGCVRSPTRPNPPNDEIWLLPRRAVALGAHGQRAMMPAARARQ